MKDETKNIAETFFEHLPNLLGAEDVSPAANTDLSKPSLVAVPEGKIIKDITPYVRAAATAFRPLARSGTARIEDVKSFIDWTNRHKDDDSVIFSSSLNDAFSLTSVIDYNKAGPSPDATGPDDKARNGNHRGYYAFPLSKEWKAWKSACSMPLSGAELGEFIEDRADDILTPPPSFYGSGEPTEQDKAMMDIALKLGGRFGGYNTLKNLANEFKVQEHTGIVAKTNRDTGETTVQFINEHKEPDGTPINIPNVFMIAVPVFDGGAAYRLAVRLRYRRQNQAVVWLLSIYNAQAAVDMAWKEAVNLVRQETGLPVFAGASE